MSARQAATRKLYSELRQLQKEPIDGVVIDLEQDNIFSWKLALFGPPDTPYQGGYFKAQIDFPEGYPFSPPTMRFTSRIWHPNVFPNGTICISILHQPGPDDLSGERPEERWNPTQTVRTILLSVISILNEPNTSSPANVDANVSYLKYKRGEGDEYIQRVKHDVQASKRLAEEDGVEVPSSIEDYVRPHKPEEDHMMTMDDMLDSDVGSDEDEYDYECEEEDDEEEDHMDAPDEAEDVAPSGDEKVLRTEDEGHQ